MLIGHVEGSTLSANPGYSDVQSVLVQTIALDDYFRDYFGSFIIKLDAEGHEYSILLGTTKLRQTRWTTIITEFYPELTRPIISPEEYLCKLTIEYSVFDLGHDQSKFEEISQENARPFARNLENSTDHYTNLLLVQKNLPNYDGLIAKCRSRLIKKYE